MKTPQIALALLMILCASLQVSGDEWESLFDGKTLKGWEGDEKLWSVQDGAITGLSLIHI